MSPGVSRQPPSSGATSSKIAASPTGRGNKSPRVSNGGLPGSNGSKQHAQAAAHDAKPVRQSTAPRVSRSESKTSVGQNRMVRTTFVPPRAVQPGEGEPGGNRRTRRSRGRAVSGGIRPSQLGSVRGPVDRSDAHRRTLANNKGNLHQEEKLPGVSLPEVGFNADASPIEETLLNFQASINDYAQTLLDPWNNVSKIPFESPPSASLTIEQRFDVTVDSNGRFQVWFGMAGPIETDNASYYNCASLVPQHYTQFIGETVNVLGFKSRTDHVLDPSHLLKQGNVAAPFQTHLFYNGWGSTSDTDRIGPEFSSARLVSWGANCISTAAMTDTSGSVLAAAMRSDFFDPAAVIGTSAGEFDLTADDLRTIPGNVEVPVNKLEGLTVRMFPTDNKSLEYVSVSSVDDSDDGYPANLPTSAKAGFAVFYGSGLAAGKTFLITVHANFEFLPKTSTYVSITPSVNDAQMIDEAFRIVGDAPMAYAGSEQVWKTAGTRQEYGGSLLAGGRHVQHTKRKMTSGDHVARLPNPDGSCTIYRVPGPQPLTSVMTKSGKRKLKRPVGGVDTSDNALSFANRMLVDWVPFAARLALGVI